MGEKEILITIFTPTYNRANLLPRLFESLIKLNEQDFEWLIVDDGSTDNTEELVKEFIKKAAFTISYFKKRNEGKHMAINDGVRYASGELFFIVDSDDFLDAQALNKIRENYKEIENHENIAGLGFLRKDQFDNFMVKSNVESGTACNILDFFYKYKSSGEIVFVLKTKILKKYPFPSYKNERFCKESLIWNRISGPYKILFINEVIYYGEYLDSGLTSEGWLKIIKNPQYSMLSFQELACAKIPYKDRYQATENFWKVASFKKLLFYKLIFKIPFLLSFRFFLNFIKKNIK